MKLNDLTGQRFGRLVVIGRAPNHVTITLRPYLEPIKTQYAKWRCRCDCGNEIEALGLNLRAGRTTSCGCYRREWRRHENQTRSRRSDADQSA